MENKILVTGASGNIGQPLVATLKARGADFAAMRSKSASAAQGIETRIADFSDVAALTAAFRGIDTLFLLFPLVENKLALAKNAAAAARAAGVKHIVRSSGAGADAASPFALPKLQGQIDEVLAATGIATTFLRPAGFMQNYAVYQTQAIKAGIIYMADGGKSQSLIDARDIADVGSAILTDPEPHAGRVYTLTGGESFSGVDAAAMISKATGKTVSHVSVPTEVAVKTMQDWNMPAFIVGIMDSLNHLVSAGYASAVSPDAERLLGRKRRTFQQYAEEHAAAWR
jgi:uncharacterized protein YbjT (DUF2867 family)